MCCQNVVLQCKLIDEGVIWSLKAFWELLCEEGQRLGKQQVHTTCPPQNVEVENILLGTPTTLSWALLLPLLLLSYSKMLHLSGPSPQQETDIYLFTLRSEN